MKQHSFLSPAQHRLPLSLATVSIILIGLMIAHNHSWAQTATSNNCSEDQPLRCPLHHSQTLTTSLQELTIPSLTPPVAPTPTITRPISQKRTLTYEVITRGNITADLATFKTQAQQTYDDDRGWKQLGLTFTPVSSGGNFTLVLASAEQLPLFSSACSSDYSCRVGRYVIINQDRWQGATPSWNSAGGSLRDYRHMVINHETGHWLGHGHSNCPAAGQPAPVMQQQSINLQGCTFNAWPIANELRAPNLGI